MHWRLPTFWIGVLGPTKILVINCRHSETRPTETLSCGNIGGWELEGEYQLLPVFVLPWEDVFLRQADNTGVTILLILITLNKYWMNSFILSCLFLLCILAKMIHDPGFVSPERFFAIESKNMDFLLFLNLVSETPYVALMQAAISSGIYLKILGAFSSYATHCLVLLDTWPLAYTSPSCPTNGILPRWLLWSMTATMFLIW